MVETFDQNQNQLQAELLRHGALNWVTRGVYFGDQRNYYEANIDDNFLPDDSWSTATTRPTTRRPMRCARDRPTSNTPPNGRRHNKFRIDMLFNGGGSAQLRRDRDDRHRSAADGVPDHTRTRSAGSATPGITRTSTSAARRRAYIEAELNQNNAWAASALGLTASTSPTAALGNNNPSVIVTGEHSGLANLLPGNPGVVDPPNLSFAEAETAETAKGTLAAGSYVYAVTDDFARRRRPVDRHASPRPVTVTGAGARSR